MFKRFIVRIVGTLVTLVVGLAISASRAFAMIVPDPGVPTPGPTPGSGSGSGGGSGTDRLPAVAPTSSSVVIFGMTWQLALAVAIFAIAGALFLATAVQRRHVAHA